MALTNINPFTTETAKSATLGQIYTDGSGRTFRYAKAGGSILARGKLVVAAGEAANHKNMSFQAAPAVGDRDVKVTLGATALTADQYKDGWFVVQDGTGEGRAYGVEGHAAADSAATATIRLKEAIDTAGATGELNCDLILNIYDGLVISVTDQQDTPIGVPVVAVAASSYFWVQTGGPVSVLQDEVIAVGQAVTIGSSVAGAVELQDAAGEPQIGVVPMHATVDTEYSLVNLTLDTPER